MRSTLLGAVYSDPWLLTPSSPVTYYSAAVHRETPGSKGVSRRWQLFHPRAAGPSRFGAIAIALFIAAAAYASDAPTARLINSPQIKSRLLVSVGLPYGAQYRPGYGFPLKVLITNSGAPIPVDVLITQGEGDSGIRVPIFAEHTLGAGTTQSPAVCVRVPDIEADLNVIVREPGLSGTVLFRGSLRPVLQSLPDESRVVLCCGANSADGLPREYNDTIHLDAKELPIHGWMYESIDLVILSDATFKDASSDAKEALRNWVLSGGRLLLTASGPAGALKPAMAARLLPLSPNALRGQESIPTDFKWWQENMGLTSADILKRRANQQPVYVKSELGFGHVVFLFPGNDDADARAFGLSVINDPFLQRNRDKFPDFRVQTKAFDTAVHGVMGSSRMRTAANWFAIGALIFCGLIIACGLIRSRLEAIGWVVCLAAVLAVMLNSFFPEPQRVVSRVQWTQLSEDGRAIVRREWAQSEAFRRDQRVSATGPAGGSLVPLYQDRDRLADAAYESAEQDDHQQLFDLRVSTDTPALLLGLDSDERPADRDDSVTIRSREDGTTLTFHPPRPDFHPSFALWIDSHGRRTFIEQADSPQGFVSSAVSDEPAAIRATVGSSGGQEVIKARAAALMQAVKVAVETQRDTLIFWSGGGEDFEPLIEFTNDAGNSGSSASSDKPAEEGARFVLWSTQARRAK